MGANGIVIELAYIGISENNNMANQSKPWFKLYLFKELSFQLVCVKTKKGDHLLTWHDYNIARSQIAELRLNSCSLLCPLCPNDTKDLIILSLILKLLQLSLMFK